MEKLVLKRGQDDLVRGVDVKDFSNEMMCDNTVEFQHGCSVAGYNEFKGKRQSLNIYTVHRHFKICEWLYEATDHGRVK